MKPLGKAVSGQQAALCHEENHNRSASSGQEMRHLLQSLQFESSRRKVGCTLVLAERCDCGYTTSCCLSSGAAEGDRHTARRPIYSNPLPDVLGES